MNTKNSKIFQDATQGYIEVDNVYAEELIDTLYLQREKNVSQTGLQAVFAGATHDRFSHSLGVFGMGKKIYAAFMKKARIIINKPILKDYRARLLRTLTEGKVLFEIACLLHDIGHPGFSHTFEYLYDDDYINLGDGFNIKDDKDVVIIYDKNEIKRLLDRYNEILAKENISKKHIEYKYLETLKKAESGKDLGNDFNAQPHEIMSAYQILSVDFLQKAIREVLKKVYKEFDASKFKKDLAFISRMITGCKYDIRKIDYKDFSKKKDKNKKHDKKFYIECVSLECSLRNCIIELLNGKIDADSIDYLNRNSHFAGYASNTLDISRLCSAFSVRLDKNRKSFELCISKNALSSLDGFIQGRYFEPKWLYSHHKIVYHNDVLLKYLMKISSVCLFKEHQEKLEEALLEFLFNNEKYELYKIDRSLINEAYAKYSKDFKNKGISKRFLTLLIKNNQNKPSIKNLNYKAKDFCIFLCKYCKDKQQAFKKIEEFKDCCMNIFLFIKYINDFIGKCKYSFTSYILSPVIMSKTRGEIFFKANDSDIEHLFKNCYNKFKLKELTTKTKDKKQEFRLTLFKDLLEEFETRNYRKSFWKSYEEYRLFLEDVIKGLPVDINSAHNVFTKLITDQYLSACFIEFEDVTTYNESLKSDIKALNGIYVNYFEQNVTQDKSEEFKKVFNCFGEGMIIRFCSCKYKSYDDLLIEFNGNHYEKYGKVQSGTYKRPEPLWFPYIYYKKEKLQLGKRHKDQVEYRNILYNKFKKEVHNYIKSLVDQSMNIYDEMNFVDGKIIRDAVHGDIFVEKKYLNIIDTKVFQRLHRIKQLATANTVFPEAVHTRFAHSLGTFWIMKQIVNHFCNIFDKFGVEYSQKDKDVVLVAALLHDIGHGPLSHALEELSDNKHEYWTEKIIAEDEELNTVLNSFGYDFKDKVIKCLKHTGENSLTLNDVLAELVSSNLDADRLDYLMRDSYNTGIKFGIVDLQKLISAMILTEYNGKPRIALQMDALPVVEQYLSGRYNMYSNVYYAPRKLLTEQVFTLLCKRIVDKADKIPNGENNNLLNELSNLNIYKLIKNTISVKEYLQLDDYSVIEEISSGVKTLKQEYKDEIAELLFDSFKNRRGFEKKNILDNSFNNHEIFFNKMKEKDFDKYKYSVVIIQNMFNAYDYTKTEKEILFINDFGKVKPFSQMSKFFAIDDIKDKKLWQTAFRIMYFNKEIAKREYDEMTGAKDKSEEAISLIEQIMNSYDITKHTEIENKFHCSEKDIIIIKSDIESNLTERNQKVKICDDFYVSSKIKEVEQDDEYYDTDDFCLARNGYSLRCRKTSGKNVFTLKKPGNFDADRDETQFIRIEFNYESKKDNISDKDVKDFLNENNLVQEITENLGQKEFSLSQLKKVITIKNNRIFFDVNKTNVPDYICEVCLDSIEYIRNEGTTIKDNQIEIELKCSYEYRVILNEFAKKLCAKYEIETSRSKSNLSKYIEALKSFDLI